MAQPQHPIDYVVRQAARGPAGAQAVSACVSLCKERWFVNGFSAGYLNIGMTALCAAAQSGCEGGVHALLSANADPNLAARRMSKAPPLVLAAMNTSSSKPQAMRIMQSLLRAGARPEICDVMGRTALHHVARRGTEYLLAVLVLHNKDVDYRDHNEFTPLILAAKYGHLGCYKALLNNGAYLHARDANGMNCLMHAAVNGHVDVVAEAVQNGIQTDLTAYERGPTALAYAAREGHARVVEYLCDFGSNMEARCGESALTVLHEAASAGELQCVRVLLDSGANIHAVCKNGRTALHFGAGTSQKDLVQLLVARGADVNQKSEGSVVPAMYAAHHDNVGGLRALLEAGADVIAVTPSGDSALSWAAVGNAVAATRFLLEAGAAPNVLDDFGTTPLHHAAETGAHEVIAHLLQHGACANMPNLAGETPLHEAVRVRGVHRVSIVQQLLRHGADPNARSLKQPMTPFQVAILVRSLQVVQLLACYGGHSKTLAIDMHRAAVPQYSKLCRFLKAMKGRPPLTVRFMLQFSKPHVPRRYLGYVTSDVLASAARAPWASTKKVCGKAERAARLWWKPFCAASAFMFTRKEHETAHILFLSYERLRGRAGLGFLPREKLDDILSFLGAM